MAAELDVLTGLSVAELEVLADGLLAPARQARLGELLAKNNDGPLSADEERELDRLLEVVDHLTVLKARARYTLAQLAVGVGAT